MQIAVGAASRIVSMLLEKRPEAGASSVKEEARIDTLPFFRHDGALKWLAGELVRASTHPTLLEWRETRGRSRWEFCVVPIATFLFSLSRSH